MRTFTFEHASDFADALVKSAADPDAGTSVAAPTQYLAGGTNLVDLMKLGVMTPGRVIDIAALGAELGGIDATAERLYLGALAKMADAAASRVVRRDYPVIAEALLSAASPQLRNMATLGGNVLQRTRCAYFRDPRNEACNKRAPGSGCAARDGVNRRLAVLGVSEHCLANYPGDFAIALVALGTVVELVSVSGETRRIAFEDLHRLPGDEPHRETNLRPGDLLLGFHVPAGPWTRRSRYVKIRDRASYDFALASAAVALQLDADGTVAAARIGIGGLAAKPWRAHRAEAIVTGARLDEACARAAADSEFASAVATGDLAFKPELGRRTVVRALLEAAALEIDHE